MNDNEKHTGSITQLPRYGIRWNGPENPVAEQMADGHWTPWHLAKAACDATGEEVREVFLRSLEHAKGLVNYDYIRAHALKATYPTATPLKDEIAALRKERDELRAENDRLRTWVSTVAEALGAIEPVSDCRVELDAAASANMAEALRAEAIKMRENARDAVLLSGTLQAALAEADARVLELEAATLGPTWRYRAQAAEARVAELETDRVRLRGSMVGMCEQAAAGATERAEKAETERDVLRARVAELERWEVTGRAAHAENVTLKADLREAVEVLQDLCEQVRAGRGIDTLHARSFLAKHTTI